MFVKRLLPIVLAALLPLQGWGQGGDDSFEAYRRKRQEEFNEYRDRQRREFEEYRRKRNEEFASYLREKWKGVRPKPLTPKPREEKVPPVVRPREDVTPAPKPKQVPVVEVVPVPHSEPQPKPVNPIEEVPVTPVTPAQPVVTFSFFGTTDKVRFDRKNLFRLKELDENAIGDAWLKMSEESYTNLLHDCLQLRQKYALCDWAYLTMLRNISESICGKGTNESVALMAYVYCQSGYQMRMAIDRSGLHLLVGSRHHIYDLPYFKLGELCFYPFLRQDEKICNQVQVCGKSFPGEKAMSLLLPHAQGFALDYGDRREIGSKRFPEMHASVRVNQNLMAFYNTYPTSMLDGNVMTRWAMYANTPMAKDVAEQLYPRLRILLQGKSQLEAVNMLLNWVQTGFEYEYDDKLWGGDRAFFAEESLYYPYCDCEDRSILFTRLVRDLLGLKCILVYYPGHLAAAVLFTKSVEGDYIELKGQKYIVTDPTYIGAPAGMTMPSMDNQNAKVILLK